MTVKEFFKGKAFKCIAVLTCVLLVSGVLLAICWGFLEVTDQERFARKINKMYNGEQVTATEQENASGDASGAHIEKVWFIEEKKDYLVQAYSKGYGGNITCWISVQMQDDLKTVKGPRNVILYQVADAAELVGNIGDDIYKKFAEEYAEGKKFEYGTKGSDDFIQTNASYSMSAICNNVNGAIEFVKAYASGGTVEDPYKDYLHRDKIDMDKTSWSAEGGVVTYDIVTSSNAPAGAFELTIKVDASGKITDYTVDTNGSTNQEYKDKMAATALALKDKTLADVEGYLANSPEGSLNTGATRSNELCYNAAAFALANYEKCVSSPKEATVNE